MIKNSGVFWNIVMKDGWMRWQMDDHFLNCRDSVGFQCSLRNPTWQLTKRNTLLVLGQVLPEHRSRKRKTSSPVMDFIKVCLNV